jgi:hypothetical protein
MDSRAQTPTHGILRANESLERLLMRGYGVGSLYDSDGLPIKCQWSFTQDIAEPPRPEIDTKEARSHLAAALLSDACSGQIHSSKIQERLGSCLVGHHDPTRSDWELLYAANKLLAHLPRYPPTPNFRPLNTDSHEYQLTSEYLIPGHDCRKNSRDKFGDFNSLSVVSELDLITAQLALVVAEAKWTPAAAYIGFQIRDCVNEVARTLNALLDISETQ